MGRAEAIPGDGTVDKLAVSNQSLDCSELLAPGTCSQPVGESRGDIRGGHLFPRSCVCCLLSTLTYC